MMAFCSGGVAFRAAYWVADSTTVKERGSLIFNRRYRRLSPMEFSRSPGVKARPPSSDRMNGYERQGEDSPEPPLSTPQKAFCQIFDAFVQDTKQERSCHGGRADASA